MTLRGNAWVGDFACRLVADKLHVIAKLGIVCHFNAVADGETKSAADAIEIVVAGMQDNLADFLGAAEVDLDPFCRAGSRFDLAVIAALSR
jgi:hypothetical protein